MMIITVNIKIIAVIIMLVNFVIRFKNYILKRIKLFKNLTKNEELTLKISDDYLKVESN